MADIEKARAFLTNEHWGVLTTYRADGRAQSSPVVSALGADGRLHVSATAPRAKTLNARRRPYATYCGFTKDFFGSWVQIEGPVEVIDQPAAMELLVALYRAVAGEHPDWDDYRAAQVREKRCLIAITIERVVAVVR